MVEWFLSLDSLLLKDKNKQKLESYKSIKPARSLPVMINCSNQWLIIFSPCSVVIRLHYMNIILRVCCKRWLKINDHHTDMNNY